MVIKYQSLYQDSADIRILLSKTTKKTAPVMEAVYKNILTEIIALPA
jgi:hypothetical protein